MIVKRIYEVEEAEDHSCQWFDCDKAIEWYNPELKYNELLMYEVKNENDVLIGKIGYDPKNKNGFNVYFLEDGKTVDTRHWNIK